MPEVDPQGAAKKRSEHNSRVVICCRVLYKRDYTLLGGAGEVALDEGGECV